MTFKARIYRGQLFQPFSVHIEIAPNQIKIDEHERSLI